MKIYAVIGPAATEVARFTTRKAAVHHIAHVVRARPVKRADGSRIPNQWEKGKPDDARSYSIEEIEVTESA